MRKFDFIPYLTRPRIGATTGLIVSVHLVRTAEQLPLPETAVPFLQAVRDAAEELRLVVRARQRDSSSARRPADRRFDAAYGGFYRRLQSWSKQEGEPEAARAQALLDHLFPSGLEFLSYKLEDEWVYSRELLAEIADKGLETQIAELIGARFMDVVQKAHSGLGKVLGLEGKTPPPVPTLRESTAVLADAITNYARVLAGTATDDASLDVFEAAMKPLTDHRERMNQRIAATRAANGELGEDDEGDLFDIDELEFDLDTPLPELGETMGASLSE